jgi:hypothetical protein
LALAVMEVQQEAVQRHIKDQLVVILYSALLLLPEVVEVAVMALLSRG